MYQISHLTIWHHSRLTLSCLSWSLSAPASLVISANWIQEYVYIIKLYIDLITVISDFITCTTKFYFPWWSSTWTLLIIITTHALMYPYDAKHAHIKLPSPAVLGFFPPFLSPPTEPPGQNTHNIIVIYNVYVPCTSYCHECAHIKDLM